ncbi:MAG: prepilin-type N-terminal cleavage/methylation domain-containing protein [Proteobacteria bacterium]|nr:prepilin-type N-terminal cleavage/methylation domain-containing protein [Pseudomonadota bacterium]
MRSDFQRGFTLVEMMIAMTIVTLIAASIYGVVSIGARSAGSGERVTEQARRHRVATGLITRQLSSAVAIRLEDEDGESVPYFLGESESVEFVTAAPQRPDSSGMGLVRYWYEDGALLMSEMPAFAVAGANRLGVDLEDYTLTTVLFYDVDRFRVDYLRTSNDIDDWEESWDAADSEELPSVVRFELSSQIPGGPSWTHEVPVYVAAINELHGEDDFRGVKSIKSTLKKKDKDSDKDPDKAESQSKSSSSSKTGTSGRKTTSTT